MNIAQLKYNGIMPVEVSKIYLDLFEDRKMTDDMSVTAV